MMIINARLLSCQCILRLVHVLTLNRFDPYSLEQAYIVQIWRFSISHDSRQFPLHNLCPIDMQSRIHPKSNVYHIHMRICVYVFMCIYVYMLLTEILLAAISSEYHKSMPHTGSCMAVTPRRTLTLDYRRVPRHRRHIQNVYIVQIVSLPLRTPTKHDQFIASNESGAMTFSRPRGSAFDRRS